MIALLLVLLIPFGGVLLMLIAGGWRLSGWLNILITVADFAATLFLQYYFWRNGAFECCGHQFYVDAFNLLLVLLTTFVIMTTAFFSRNYMWHNVSSGRITSKQLLLYHAMYQLFAGMLLLALLANNLGILWVAMEGATLATVLLVSLYRTPEAVEAAWKYFILCIIGIALALFGTILVYFSAAQVVAVTKLGIYWTVLLQHAAKLDPTVIKLAFVFLLVGYGTKIGLVPLHNWLPDAHSESPAPMSTLLSGLLLNVALYALLRFKVLVDLALNTHLAGTLMMGFGLLSFIVAAVLLQRQTNIKRLFSYSSIEHMGAMTFAFGLGNPIATFAGLFYLLMHSLAKSAIFVIVGNVIQLTGTQSMERIRGLIRNQKLVGWLLLLSVLAISGMPPFGIFTSEVLLLIATIKTVPWLAVILLLGLLLALAGLLRNIQPVVFGEPMEIKPTTITVWPAVLHLGLVLILGVYLPSWLGQWLLQAMVIISN